MSVYMIGLGGKHLSVRSMNVEYLVGFEKNLLARKVQYWLPPYPELSVVRGDSITVSPASFPLPSPTSKLVMDTSATLFISKTSGSIWHPMNDIGFYLDVKNEDDFLMYPFTKRAGIIIPQNILSETEDEFVIRSCIIEPIH